MHRGFSILFILVILGFSSCTPERYTIKVGFKYNNSNKIMVLAKLSDANRAAGIKKVRALKGLLTEVILTSNRPQDLKYAAEQLMVHACGKEDSGKIYDVYVLGEKTYFNLNPICSRHEVFTMAEQKKLKNEKPYVSASINGVKSLNTGCLLNYAIKCGLVIHWLDE